MDSHGSLKRSPIGDCYIMISDVTDDEVLAVDWFFPLLFISYKSMFL